MFLLIVQVYNLVNEFFVWFLIKILIPISPSVSFPYFVAELALNQTDMIGSRIIEKFHNKKVKLHF